MNIKKKYRNDLLLLLVVIILAVILFLVYKAGLKPGNYIEITYQGNVIATYPLEQDRLLLLQNDKVQEITDPNRISSPDHFNLLEISQGKADMLEASCPDLICVNQHSISKIGEAIICLPNKTIVTVVGSEKNLENEQIDFISR